MFSHTHIHQEFLLLDAQASDLVLRREGSNRTRSRGEDFFVADFRRKQGLDPTVNHRC